MKPNILLIVLDTVRYDHLSCYGYERETTPFLDSICDELVRFENVITPAHWTLPSHASIFTGLYPGEHGMWKEYHYLSTEIPTLAEIFAKFGYHTVCFSNNIFVGKKTGLHRGFQDMFEEDNFRDISVYKRHILVRLVAKTFRTLKLASDEWGRIYSCKRAVDSVIRWLDKIWQPSSPFFMFINFLDAHWPLYPPKSFREKFNALECVRTVEPQHKVEALAHEIHPEQVKQWLALYDASIAHLDSQLERLYTYLQGKGILDDTIIVILSDHGDYYGEHGLFGHSIGLYDPLIRVPMLIRYPELFPPGTVFKPQVQTMDIFPTLLEACRINLKHLCRRRSLIQQMRWRLKEDEYAFAECYGVSSEKVIENILNYNPNYDLSRLSQSCKCVRTLKYKYIWSSSGNCEFYDLQNDPEETKNLIHKDIPWKKHLKHVLEEWTRNLTLHAPPIKGEEDNELVKQRLAELGYI